MNKTERADRDVVEAIRTGDGRYLRPAIQNPAFDRPWLRATRQIARLGPMSKRTQKIYLRFHVRFGHDVRRLIGDDPALITALHVLMPPYRGPAVMLYRGDYLTRGYQRRPFGLS